jgi:isopentenyl-diphosphate delta-isomerase
MRSILLAMADNWLALPRRSSTGNRPQPANRFLSDGYRFDHDADQCHRRRTPMTVVDDPVVLVNAHGEPIGQQLKSAVHTATTPLHLAFSLYLFNAAGQLLLTRRALSKRTWPGVWTNSCCGHPRPDEPLADAVRRRLDTELGLAVEDLSCALPDFAYTALDASGIRENEICPVFVGSAVHPNVVPAPNEDEAMDWAWVDWRDVVTAMAATPFAFSPWAVCQVRQLTGPAAR